MKDRRINKHCPKCGGSLFHVDDIYGAYEQCLQCGFIRYPTAIRLPKTEEELINSQT